MSQEVNNLADSTVDDLNESAAKLPEDPTHYDDKARAMLRSSLTKMSVFEKYANNINIVLDELAQSDDPKFQVALLKQLEALTMVSQYNPYFLQTETNLFDILLQLISTNIQEVPDHCGRLLKLLVEATITAEQLMRILNKFSDDKLDSSCRKRLLSALRDTPPLVNPGKAFMFTGGVYSGIHIPPIHNFLGNNFSIVFWISCDIPSHKRPCDPGMPFIFSFRTEDGQGCSCRLLYNCLYFVFRSETKHTTEFCVQRKINAKKWTCVVLSYKRKRMGKFQIGVYLDGQECMSRDIDFQLPSSNAGRLDRCSIGCSLIDGETDKLMGQMSHFKVMCSALSKQQAEAIFKLGVDPTIPNGHSLNLTMLMSYNAGNCDQNVVLNSLAHQVDSKHQGFVGSEHAHMLNDTVIAEHKSIHDAIHGIGSKALFVLFRPSVLQSDDPSLLFDILSILYNLLCNSYAMLDQFLSTHGFMYVGFIIGNLGPQFPDGKILEPIFDLWRFIERSVLPASPVLANDALQSVMLDILLDHCFLGRLQHHGINALLDFMAGEMSTLIAKFDHPCRLAIFHALCRFIWERSKDVVKTTSTVLRSMLQYLMYLEDAGDEELGTLMCYVDMSKILNNSVLDSFLDIVLIMLSEESKKMIPLFDELGTHRRIVSLVGHDDATISLKSMRILTVFLSHSTNLRKEKTMEEDGLFEVLAGMLLSSPERIDSLCVISLLQLMTDSREPEDLGKNNIQSSKVLIENQAMIYVICTILADPRIKERHALVYMFLNRLNTILHFTASNKRKLLRVPCWQAHLLQFLWMDNDVANKPTVTQSELYKISQQLLFYGTERELDGWRVFIDTLAILHEQMAFHRAQESESAAAQPKGFLSSYHQMRITNDLLDRIEEEVMSTLRIAEGRKSLVGSKTNTRFISNVAHVISFLADEACCACGGIMTLFNFVVRPAPNQKLPNECSYSYTENPWRLVTRLSNLVDVLILYHPEAISSVDEELSLTPGTTMRQLFRLYLYCALLSVHQHYVSPRPNTTAFDEEELARDVLSANPDERMYSDLLSSMQNLQGKQCDEQLSFTEMSSWSVIQERHYYRFKLLLAKDCLEDEADDVILMSLLYCLSVLISDGYRRHINSTRSERDHQGLTKCETKVEKTTTRMMNDHYPLPNTDQLTSQRPGMRGADSALNAFPVSLNSLSLLVDLLRSALFDHFSTIQAQLCVPSHRDATEEALNLANSSESQIPLMMFVASNEWQQLMHQRASNILSELADESRIVRGNNLQHLLKVASESSEIKTTSKAKAEKSLTIFKKDANIVDIQSQRRFAEMARQTEIRLGNTKKRCWQLEHSVEEIFNRKMFNTIQRKIWRLSMVEDKFRCRRSIVPFYCPTEDQTASNPSAHGVAHSWADELSGPIEKDSFPCKMMTPIFLAIGKLRVSESHFNFLTVDDQIQQYLWMLDIKDELTWKLSSISMVIARTNLAENDSIEIFLNDGTTLYFVFDNASATRSVVDVLPPVGFGSAYGIPRSRASSLYSPQELFSRSDATERWEKRQISNFQYLMFLNTIAGRSYQNLEQYPVFPWVIADYSSSKIDLDAAATYRDLSKPIGALNSERINALRIEQNGRIQEGNDPYLHSTCYSTTQSTLMYLGKLEPFASTVLKRHSIQPLQSIRQLWEDCQNGKAFSELIPEFYYLPEMFALLNNENRAGDSGENVEMPGWARDAHDFIRKHQMALESELVSCQLHRWIDLVFGYQQRGRAASDVNNVYKPCLYLTGSQRADLGRHSTCEDRGFIPAQLLRKQHPPKRSNLQGHVLTKRISKHTRYIIVDMQSGAAIVAIGANRTRAVEGKGGKAKEGRTKLAMMEQTPDNFILTVSKRFELACNPFDEDWVEDNSAEPARAFQSNTRHELPVKPDISAAYANSKSLGSSFDHSVTISCERFAISPDNLTIVATGFWDKSFRLVHSLDAKLRQVIFGHFGVVTCACFGSTHGSTLVATGASDSCVHLWAFDDGRRLIVGRDCYSQSVNPSPVAVLTGHKAPIQAVRMSPSVQGLVFSLSVYEQVPVVLEHSANGQCLRSLMQDGLSNDCLIDVSPNGQDDMLMVHGDELSLFAINGALLYRNKQTNGMEITTACFDRTGQFIVLGCKSGRVLVVAANGLATICRYPKCDSAITSVAVASNQRHIVAGLSNGQLVLIGVDFSRMFL